MSHCVIRNNTTDLIEKVITDTGENSILYNKIIDKLPNNIQYDQLSDYLKNQIGNGNIKDLSKEEVALAIWNKYTNQDIDGRDVDINDELDIKYVNINDDINLNSNEFIANAKPEVDETLNADIENRLKTFFNLFGFQLKEGELSTDLLKKIIYTSKNDNTIFINNSIKTLSQLLLANTNIDFNKLEALIEDTPEFKKMLENSSNYIKNTHKFLKEGNRIPMEEWVSYIKDYNKIKNTVLEKYLKESLLDKNNSTKLHQLINDFLQFFKDLFTNSKNLKEVTDSLIQQVLNNQKEVIINSKDLKNKERVTLAKALEETAHGKDIIKTFGEFGLILTGSVSAAEQGSVFRKVGKLLHDIDWVVPKGFTKDFNKKLKDTFPGATLVREFDSPTYYTQTYIVPPKGYTISNLTFFKPEIYGERKYIASYDVLDKNGKIVSNYRRYYDVKESGKVVENREVYNEGLQNVDKNLEAVSVDFFQNKEELKFKPYTVNVEGIELQLSNWMSSFTEKLKYGRAKDLLDYANFIPNNLNSNEIKPGVAELFNSKRSFADYSDFGKTLSEQEIINLKKEGNKVTAKQFLESIIPVNDFEKKLKSFLLSIDLNKLNGFDFVINDKYQGNIIGLNERELFEKPTVIFNSKSTTEPSRYKLHEFLHSLLDTVINEEQEFRTELITLFDYVKTLPKFKNEYGVIGWWEFYTEGMTNPDFQAKLKNVTLSGYKGGKKSNVYKEFVKIINNILEKLGFVNKDYSALDEIINATTKVIEKRYGYSVKPGVTELFESNPELANAVYEALGFKSFDTKGVSLDTKERDGWKWIKLNGKNIGEVKLVKNDRRSKEVGLSIKLNEEYQNKGYGQIVHTLVADWAKNEFGDTLYSDFDNSQAEINTLLALTKKGYAEQIGDYGIKENGRYSTDVRAFKIKTSDEIGTITPQQKQQALQLYSQYLDTIFPDSKVKDIVYHGGPKKIKDKFKESFTEDGNYYKGIYFTDSLEYLKELEKNNLNKNTKEVTFAIINAIDNFKMQEKIGYGLGQEWFFERYDSITGKDEGQIVDGTVYAVRKPEQIHILGSKQDIEVFKEFVDNKDTIFLKPNTGSKTFNSNTTLVNQNILSAQSSENPFKSILENILKTGKVGNMTNLDLFYAKLLLDNLNTFNPKLRIADLGGPLGNINIATQVITLDVNLLKSGNYEAIVQTVLHEVGHGFLVFPFAAVSGELNEADRMFKLTVSNLFANYKAKHKAANKKFGDDVENGFKDAEEFLSEFISSKTFRDYLYDLDRTLLQRMWDSIKTFFRYKVTRKESNDYKALDTIINSYILNGKTVNALRFKHQLKRTTFNKNRASTLQDVKANIIKEIDRLMIDLRDKSYGSSTLKKLNQLQDELLDVSEETAIDLYLERVDSIFSKTVAKFNAIEKDLHNIDNWKLDEFNDLFYTMNMYKSYLKNFNMWDAGDEQSITEFLRANDMPIDPRIDLLAGKKRSIDFLYSRIAVKLVSRSLASKELLEELNANITDSNKKITYEQLEQSLKYLTDVQDINAPSLQAEAAINSKDLITALVANKIKSALNDAIEEDVNLESKLSLLYNKAFSRVESTVNSFKTLFGKYVHEVEYLEHTDYDDSKNKVYTKVKKKAFITEIDFAKYQANKNALYASLEKLPELPKPDNEDYQILIRDYREIKARNNVKISLWSKQNEELHPDYQKIMDKKKEYLSAKEYDDWFKSNTDTLNGDFKVPESRKDKLIGQNENGDWIIAKKELVTPKKSMYTNPKWASVKDDKFYMALLAAYNEANMKLPKSKRLKYGVIPQRPKSWKEYTIEGRVPKNRLTGKGAKELEEKWGKNYTEVEEKEFWNAGLHTIDTKSYLPIYYTSSIDEDDVSMDLLQSVLKFASSSNKFSAFYKINPEISLMKDVVFGTNVIDRMEGRYTIKTDNKGNPTGEKINVTTKANEQLMSFLENSFYNTKLESPKAARVASNITGFTSFVQLGGNLISAIPNAIYANFVVAQEAIFSKHFGGKGDLVKAHTIVSGSLVHDLAKFSGAVEHIDSKTAFLAKLFQAVQGNHQNEFGENASNKMMNNLFSQNSFFILYSIPEYEIQTTTMVAMMLKTMVKTKSGESISLWDAYEQDETGRVALKPGVIFTKDQRNALIGKLHKANKELHGNYNKFDTPKLKRIWYGKFLFQFRNHIFEGFKRRFVKEYYDVEAREYKKGYYRSGIDAGLNALTYGYLGLVKLMELAGVQMDKDKYKFVKLSAPDKMDSAKMFLDVAVVVGLYFVILGLQAMAKAGDDDDELVYYALTTAKKVQTDISFYWLIDFDALIKQVRNPAVVMSFAENLLKGTELLVKSAYQDPNDPTQISYYKINTGKYKKGDLKAKKYLYKAIPLLNQYERDVKEVAEWYLNPN